MPVRPTRVRRLKARKAVARVTLAGAVLTVIGGYFAISKTVTLVVEGQPEPVRTMSSSVGELLESHGIEVGGRALVVPPEATAITDGMTVVVEHDFFDPIASDAPLSFATATSSSASTDVGAWVMEGVDGSATLLAARSTEDWFSAGAPVGQSDVTTARVVVLGKDHEVLTDAATVGALLSAMGIEPDRDDRVLPSPSAPLHPGDTIRYTSVDFRLSTLEVPVPFTTHTTYTEDLDPGQVRVTTEGENGLMRETYRERVVNGRVVGRQLLHREVLEAAVAEERRVGRREVATTSNARHGVQVGEASWYSFAPGNGFTAAHPWLPFGTVVSVTNLSNGRTVTVTINDRGPFGGRIIDLSQQAFARIAPLGQGVAHVRLTW